MHPSVLELRHGVLVMFRPVCFSKAMGEAVCASFVPVVPGSNCGDTGCYRSSSVPSTNSRKWVGARMADLGLGPGSGKIKIRI